MPQRWRSRSRVWRVIECRPCGLEPKKQRIRAKTLSVLSATLRLIACFNYLCALRLPLAASAHPEVLRIFHHACTNRIEIMIGRQRPQRICGISHTEHRLPVKNAGQICDEERCSKYLSLCQESAPDILVLAPHSSRNDHSQAHKLPSRRAFWNAHGDLIGTQWAFIHHCYLRSRRRARGDDDLIRPGQKI